MRHVVDAVWVWSTRSENRLVDEASAGKWLIYDWDTDKIEHWFKIVDQMVDDGRIYRAKYALREHPNDPLMHTMPVLCVYADHPSRRVTLERLLEFGIVPAQWKYDSETSRDWAEGGALREFAEVLARRRTIPTAPFP